MGNGGVFLSTRARLIWHGEHIMGLNGLLWVPSGLLKGRSGLLMGPSGHIMGTSGHLIGPCGILLGTPNVS